MGRENINPNLGLVQKPLPRGGPMVTMVKSKPGVFYDGRGEICSGEMAEQAGFDVKALKRLKAKNDALARSQEEIEARFREESKKLDGMSDEELGLEDPAGGDEPDDGSPFVLTNSSDQPRTARTAQDGPVKTMEYVQAGEDRGWVVKNRDTGEILDDGEAIGLDKDEAEARLLRED